MPHYQIVVLTEVAQCNMACIIQQNILGLEVPFPVYDRNTSQVKQLHDVPVNDVETMQMFQGTK